MDAPFERFHVDHFLAIVRLEGEGWLSETSRRSARQVAGEVGTQIVHQTSTIKGCDTLSRIGHTSCSWERSVQDKNVHLEAER